MATQYQKYFSQGGTSNQSLPRTFSLSGFGQSTTPTWSSGRADQLTSVRIKCSLSITRNRDVTLNYSLTSGGITLTTGNFSKSMNAGSVYNGTGYLNIGELTTAAQVTAFINGLPSASLAINASFSSGADLSLYKKGGVEFSVTALFVDLEGSTFMLDKTEYTSGDRPVLDIEPMDTEGTLAHEVRWTIGDYIGNRIRVEGTNVTLPEIPDSFASYVTSVSAPMALHCYTIEDGVELGERIIEVTYTAKNMIPTVTVTATPLDGGTDYWQKFDGCRLNIVCNSANSEHKNLTITGAYSYDGPVVDTVDAPIFQTGGSKQFVITYTNMRDQVAKATVNINVNTLKAPTISAFDAQRYEGVTGDDGQTVYKWSVTSNKVRLRYAFTVDGAGGNISPSDVSMVIKADGNTIRGTTSSLISAVEYDNSSSTSTDKSILSALSFNASESYEITFTVSDGMNSATASVTIPKARTNLHIAASDYGVGIGTFVEGTSADNPRFVCDYPAEFRNGIVGLEPKIVLDDRDSYNNANNALIIHDVTVEESGWFFLQANFEFGNNANGRRGFEVEVTGEVHSVPIALMLPPVNGDALRGSAATFVHLYAGDVLHFRTYQTSGTTLAVGVGRRLVKLF